MHPQLTTSKPGRLTEKALRAMRPGDVLSDDVVTGLRARKQRHAVTFEFRYRAPHSRRRHAVTIGPWGAGTITLRIEDANGNPTGQRMTIGDPRTFTLADARRKALELAATLARGADPRHAAGPDGFTLRRALEMHTERLHAKHRSARTVESYEWVIKKHLADWLDMALKHITRGMVRERHAKITKASGPVAANAALRAFRAAWNSARREDEHLGDCPTIALDWNTEHPADTALTPEGLSGWYARIQRIANPVVRDYFLFVLFTGLRRRSAAAVRWADVDFDNGLLHVPRPKGGERRAFNLPLSDFLLDLLRRRKAENARQFPNTPFVFPAESRSGHIEEPKGTIYVKGKGGRLHKVKDPSLPSPHALRHTFAAVCEHRVGIPHLHTRLLLNHAVPRGNLTWLYAGAQDIEALRASMQRVTDFLRSCLEPRPSGDVIRLPRRADQPADKSDMATAQVA